MKKEAKTGQDYVKAELVGTGTDMKIVRDKVKPEKNPSNGLGSSGTTCESESSASASSSICKSDSGNSAIATEANAQFLDQSAEVKIEPISIKSETKQNEEQSIAVCETPNSKIDVEIVRKDTPMLEVSADFETNSCIMVSNIGEEAKEKTIDLTIEDDGVKVQRDSIAIEVDEPLSNSDAPAIVGAVAIRQRSDTSDNGNEISMKSPMAIDSCAPNGEGCEESASDIGTPRVTESRESSFADAPSAESTSRESTEPKAAVSVALVVGKDGTSKEQKTRKDSKSKSERSSRTKTGVELVELIVKVRRSEPLARFCAIS